METAIWKIKLIWLHLDALIALFKTAFVSKLIRVSCKWTKWYYECFINACNL